jgi:NAD(P)H dehydrogenase (quinone)
MSIIVTGATGQLGGRVVAGLLRAQLEPGQIVALGRDSSKLAALADSTGVHTRQVDNDDREAVHAALRGAKQVLLISGAVPGARVEQHRNVIDAAAAAGAERIVYTSVLGVEHSSLPIAPDHQATERLIAESGVPAILLRNGWYHENQLPEAQLAAATGVLLSAAGTGRVATAAREDYAQAAVAALLGELEPGAYELSGDHAWDYREFAAAIAQVTGREIEVREVDRAELRAGLVAGGFPEPYADFLAGIHEQIAAGALADAPGTLARIIGRPTTPFVDALSGVSVPA